MLIFERALVARGLPRSRFQAIPGGDRIARAAGIDRGGSGKAAKAAVGATGSSRWKRKPRAARRARSTWAWTSPPTWATTKPGPPTSSWHADSQLKTQATDLRTLVATDALDADLAALCVVLAEHGVPLVVASPDRTWRKSCGAPSPSRCDLTQPSRDAIAGGVVLGGSLEDVLRVLGGGGEITDDTRDLGVVLVVRDGRLPSRTTSGPSNATRQDIFSAGRRPCSPRATQPRACSITSTGRTPTSSPRARASTRRRARGRARDAAPGSLSATIRDRAQRNARN